MDFILNEYSLQGQYPSMEEFIKDICNIAGCITLVRRYGKSTIYKTKNFYNSKITEKEKLFDLKKAHVTDELMHFQLLLDGEVYNDPYWDEEPQQDMDRTHFFWNRECVDATAMAEAAVTNRQLLSFKYDGLVDCDIVICEKTENVENTYSLKSIYTKKYLAQCFGEKLGVSRDDYIKIKFQGTRIDYSTIEDGYGADILESHEYKLLLSTLDKFVEHVSFDTIFADRGLDYKDYKPDQPEKDWFSSNRYKRLSIMKFRYSRKMRVFGYRKGETFCVLRIERDHKISDYG